MKNLFLPCLCLILFNAPVFAQFSAQADYTVEVADLSGETLRMPWVGGLNFCNFSNVHFNSDTLADLLVFDKSGNRLLGFISSPESDTVLLEFAPEATEAYPQGAVFMLAVDYDVDGDEDIFTFKNNGIQVWKNRLEESGTLSFELHNGGKNLPTELNGTATIITIPGTDVPALVDIDHDTDLDIVLFDNAGTFVWQHTNQSQELYGHSDSLIFEVTDACWGDFAESGGSRALFLDSCGKPFAPHLGQRAPHGGSSVLAFDHDGDGDYELLIGDIGYDGLTFTENVGSIADAHVDSVIYNWPGLPDPVFVDIFPAAFYVDADADGKRDMLASPIRQNDSENADGLFYYHNTGSDADPEFEFIQRGFLQQEMLDFGEGAFPAFFDFDSDGDLDIVCGNVGYYLASGDYQLRLALLENVDPSGPSFQLIDTDYADLSGITDLDIKEVYPTFGDLDGDGDQDMLLGQSDGTLYFLKNTAGAGMEASWSPETSNYQNIDVGASSTPELVDVDRDGNIDLLIGERNGNINYYRNTGTSSAPVFSLEEEVFGEVNVTSDLGGIGYSAPRLYEFDGAYHLLSGTINGTVHHYRNIDGNLSGSFEQFDTTFANHQDGERSALAIADLDADGYPEMVVGNYSGGLRFYRGEFANGIAANPQLPDLVIQPNPFSRCINTNSTGDKAEIRDLTGRLLWRGQLSGSICLEELLPGIYLLSAENHASSLIIKH